MFSFFRRNKKLFNDEEQQLVAAAIREAERNTSGEIRVYVETRCSYVDALDRAVELFGKMGMQATKERNGVLVYVALKDHQLAIYGDEGIHQKVGPQYWNEEINKMLPLFKQQKLADGICRVVNDLGEALHHHFPFNRETDKNELPDEIIFGS